MYLSETYEKKWQPVLEHPDLPKIGDSYRRAVTATILENQERAQKEDNAFLNEAAPANNTACLLYTSPSPRDATLSRMPSSA